RVLPLLEADRLTFASGVRRTRRAAVLVSLAALFALTIAALPGIPARAQGQPQREQRPPRPLIDYEAVLYRQPQLIEDTMAGIHASNPDAPSTYFVGFSAFSEQDVFLREIAQAREIVDERFGTRDRSLLLVNHILALDEVPLATITNLDIILTRLGRIMHPQKDTLILFLTSHGIENLFAIEFPPFPINHLTPPRLAEILDKSGINNRIVIISACHSGSFIPALKHPGTIVMTASRADRASFGCSNEADWTFFGNALFNHGLRTGKSLTDAFAAAKILIAGWEAKERFVPSEPQIFVGAEAGSMLARLPIRPAVETATTK
ncbi:unnamed protein product, partial [Phaeothamnion confervicola]